MNLLDASAIFNLFQAGEFDVIVDSSTISLARYEVGNILWKNYKIRGKISKDESMKLGTVIFETLDSIEQIVPSANSTLKLSIDMGLTFYDSSYLVAAIEGNYELVTDDDKLYSVAQKMVNVQRSQDLI